MNLVCNNRDKQYKEYFISDITNDLLCSFLLTNLSQGLLAGVSSTLSNAEGTIVNQLGVLKLFLSCFYTTCEGYT